jgi:hypothetical protein
VVLPWSTWAMIAMLRIWFIKKRASNRAAYNGPPGGQTQGAKRNFCGTENARPRGQIRKQAGLSSLAFCIPPFLLADSAADD